MHSLQNPTTGPITRKTLRTDAYNLVRTQYHLVHLTQCTRPSSDTPSQRKTRGDKFKPPRFESRGKDPRLHTRVLPAHLIYLTRAHAKRAPIPTNCGPPALRSSRSAAHGNEFLRRKRVPTRCAHPTHAWVCRWFPLVEIFQEKKRKKRKEKRGEGSRGEEGVGAARVCSARRRNAERCVTRQFCPPKFLLSFDRSLRTVLRSP